MQKCHTSQGKFWTFIATNVGKCFRSVRAFTIMWGNSAAKENRKASARRKKKPWVAENDSQRWVECHSNCGPITANRMMGDCLMCFPRVHRRGHGALSSVPSPNLRHCLSGWHLKCCFLTTYANCCNFPDEAASWYLDAAKIVLHFLCAHRSAIRSV